MRAPFGGNTAGGMGMAMGMGSPITALQMAALQQAAMAQRPPAHEVSMVCEAGRLTRSG